MPAFIFDLDGTLVDSVYAHVLAWQEAFSEIGIQIDGWRFHRRIGMSGGLLTHAVCKEVNRSLSSSEFAVVEKEHTVIFQKYVELIKPLRGSQELLSLLRSEKIPFGIATSGSRPGIDPLLKLVGAENDLVVEGKSVLHSKPEPDELRRCREKLGVSETECFMVGDAPWDLLAASRAQMLGIGLLTGGHHTQDLYEAGAHRVYADPVELLESLYQIGISLGNC
jgi:HAD superfamily hydrolase (TIGR01549 family)